MYMDEDRTISQRRTVPNSPRGTPIRGQRPGGFTLEFLPPEKEEEHLYMEPVASSEEEEGNEDLDSDSRWPTGSEIVMYADPRITALVPIFETDKKPDSIKAEPLSNGDRTELLFNTSPSSLSGMQFISDIYRIKGGFNFVNPCCVSMQLKIKYNETTNDLKAVVRDNGKWTEIPATLKNENAVFKLQRMDCVYVVTVPKLTEANVTEDGYEFSSDADDRIGLSVPENAVDQPTTISIKVLLPDVEIERKVQQTMNICNIMAISPCLCVEYKELGQLIKQVTVTLPLNLPSNTQDYEVVLLTLEEETVSQVRTKVEISDRGTISSKVDSPKNQLYALVKKTVDVPHLHSEIFRKFGLVRDYKVLSFRGSKHRKVLLIECTPLEKVQQVIDERTKQGYALEPKGGESQPLDLRQTQRLRIDITGKIVKDATYPNSTYFIIVLFGAYDLMTSFSFKISATLGGTYFGKLNISSDNMKRRDLCSVYFDPDM